MQTLKVAQYACSKQARKLPHGDALNTSGLTACSLGRSMDPVCLLCSGTVGVGPIPMLQAQTNTKQCAQLQEVNQDIPFASAPQLQGPQGPRLLRHITISSHSQGLSVLESRADGSWRKPQLMLVMANLSSAAAWLVQGPWAKTIIDKLAGRSHFLQHQALAVTVQPGVPRLPLLIVVKVHITCARENESFWMHTIL